MEYFKDIPGYEGFYQISSLGRIVNAKRERFLSPWVNQDGYLWITLQNNGKKKHRSLSSLVLEAFRCSRPVGLVINHIDSNRKNNALSNLEYCTQKENIHHSIRAGRFTDATKARKFRLNDEQVRYIRTSPKRNVEIAKEMELNSSLVCWIRKRIYYKHVTDE